MDWQFAGLLGKWPLLPPVTGDMSRLKVKAYFRCRNPNKKGLKTYKYVHFNVKDGEVIAVFGSSGVQATGYAMVKV